MPCITVPRVPDQRQMKRTAKVLVEAAALAALLSALTGLASSLSWGSKTLGSSTVSVPRCDTNGVTVTQNLSGSNVVSVTVAGLASACGSGTLSADVNNGSANSSGSATIPSGGGSLTVSLASAVALKDSDEVDVAISGP